MAALEGIDYFVREVPLPYSVPAAVTPNEDSTYSIYINSRLSPEQKQKALCHEIDHIESGDFYNGKPIEEVERKQ